MSSYNAKNPTGGATIRRVRGTPDPNLHLLERILSTENVRTAWERVKANKGAPGVDNVSIDQFPDRFRPQWSDIRKSILAGSYNPLPVKRVDIPKATGGTRPLGIPCVLDRYNRLYARFSCLSSIQVSPQPATVFVRADRLMMLSERRKNISEKVIELLSTPIWQNSSIQSNMTF